MQEADSHEEVQALATLVQLGRRARQARDVAELGFIAVNETYALAPYRQAALWQAGKAVTALSGVVSPEANAPYVQWLERVFSVLHKQADLETALLLDARHLPPEVWKEWGNGCLNSVFT